MQFNIYTEFVMHYDDYNNSIIIRLDRFIRSFISAAIDGIIVAGWRIEQFYAIRFRAAGALLHEVSSTAVRLAAFTLLTSTLYSCLQLRT